MRALIVIPARYGSTRLPAKPLLCETGKYLIQHVYELATKARLVDEVIVATDDQRIMAAVASFGGRALMTRSDHQSGTDRIAEVARAIRADLFLNLQGDEPKFDPAHLDWLVELMAAESGLGIATLATPIRNPADYSNPNIVKVVCDQGGRALYFSRSTIPYVRDGEPDLTHSIFLQHLGVYAYRREVLLSLADTPPHPLEQAEKLEQLRALAHGVSIKVGVIPNAHRGVDTRDDYDAFVKSCREGVS